jgi:hypothetical protein
VYYIDKKTPGIEIPGGNQNESHKAKQIIIIYNIISALIKREWGNESPSPFTPYYDTN